MDGNQKLTHEESNTLDEYNELKPNSKTKHKTKRKSKRKSSVFYNRP